MEKIPTKNFEASTNEEIKTLIESVERTDKIDINVLKEIFSQGKGDNFGLWNLVLSGHGLWPSDLEEMLIKPTTVIGDKTSKIKGIIESLKEKDYRESIIAGLKLKDVSYDSDFAFANVPFDDENLKKVIEVVENKKILNPKVLVVIGIGGSNLGTMAIHEAINGKFYNETNPKIKVYFVDTVDADYISTILNMVENELREYNNILVTVISKSGTTTETVGNFELFIELLRKYKKEKYKDYVVAITDKGSILEQYSNESGFAVLEIPKKVGGRYSVFTSVGLFPLAILGIGIAKLIEGAREMSQTCLSLDIEKNYSSVSASIFFYYYFKNIRISDTFLFAVNLEAVGKWYRQLVGESIGKEYDKNNKKVEIGITPTVSIGSTDLHSVAQLYLGGPNDKFTTFVDVQNNFTNLVLPKLNELEKLVSNIQGLEMSEIMNAIIQGTKTAYTKKQRAFCSVSLLDKSEKSIAKFLQFKMFEIAYLGHLFNINPFDQPNVELYKQETRNILKQGLK